jgi:hypothetical protein
LRHSIGTRCQADLFGEAKQPGSARCGKVSQAGAAKRDEAAQGHRTRLGENMHPNRLARREHASKQAGAVRAGEANKALRQAMPEPGKQACAVRPGWQATQANPGCQAARLSEKRRGRERGKGAEAT